MNSRTLLILGCLVAAGCVQQPRIDDPQHQALLRTWGEFMSLDGAAPPARFELQLEAGPHQVEVRYRTLQVDYYCLFEFEAVAGQVYEIIDQSNPYPLRLYRWKRQNALWASRSEPRDPSHCREA